MPSADDLPNEDDLLPPGELDARTATLRDQVAAIAAERCVHCQRSLCRHGALLAIVLGYRHQPHCADCLAAAMAEDRAVLLERARQWILHRACFRHVWREASAEEGLANGDRPACHFTSDAAFAPLPTAAAAAVSERPSPAARWNAGDLGCGDLVLELRFRLQELPPGAVLELVARDPAAPIDLPAWCGLCGHSLLHSQHPVYLIQKKRS